MLKLLAALGAGLLAASSAAAHPGHGEPGQGYTLAHYLTEPIHVVGTLVLVAAIVAGWQLVRVRRSSAARIDHERRAR